MTARINVLKITFSTTALVLLIGALVVTETPRAADSVFVPGRVYMVTGGKTTLKPTRQMIEKLRQAKVRVKPTGSAQGGVRKLTFPITGGRVGVSESKLIGVIRHRRAGVNWGAHKPGGGATGQSVRLRNPVLALKEYTDEWSTAVLVRNKKVVLFRHPGLFDTNPEDGTTRTRAQAKLTARGARLFRSKLGLNVKKGTTFGSIGSPGCLDGPPLEGGCRIFN